MRKILFILAFIIPFAANAQKGSGTDAVKKLTKFEEFTSKTGSIIKYIDVKMGDLSGSTGAGLLKVRYTASAKVRTIVSGPDKQYFFRIGTSSASAFIAYSDLVEINKAISRLRPEVESDIQANPDYLENKFTTEDDFQIGYYVSDKTATWFCQLSKYGDNELFFDKPEKLFECFDLGQKKIEELKAQ